MISRLFQQTVSLRSQPRRLFLAGQILAVRPSRPEIEVQFTDLLVYCVTFLLGASDRFSNFLNICFSQFALQGLQTHTGTTEALEVAYSLTSLPFEVSPLAVDFRPLTKVFRIRGPAGSVQALHLLIRRPQVMLAVFE